MPPTTKGNARGGDDGCAMPDTPVASLFAIGEANPIVGGAATGALLDIIGESVRETVGWLDGNGLKGTRSRNIARTREGQKIVAGSFSLYPSSFDLSYLLRKLYGATPSGTDYGFGETLSGCYIQKKFGASGNRVATFAGCVLSQGRFSSRAGEMLMAEFDVIGLTATMGSTAPTVTLNTSTTQFTHSDSSSSITINGSAYECFDFAVTINNAVQARQVNSRTATAVYATDRIVTVELTLGSSDILTSTIIDQTLPVNASYAANNQSLIFDFAAVRFTNLTPVIGDRDEIRYQLTGQAFKSGSTAEIVTTLDSTP